MRVSILVCFTRLASNTASKVSILEFVEVISVSIPSTCPIIVSCFASVEIPPAPTEDILTLTLLDPTQASNVSTAPSISLR